MHTTCWYNNDGRAGPVSSHTFGLASYDEMCIAYVGYYPKVADRRGSYCKPFGGGGLPFDSFLGVTTKDSGTSEEAFTNRSFGRPASLVASEGLFAGGIATASSFGADPPLRTTCGDSPTIGTLEIFGDPTCDELLEILLSQQPSSTKMDICSTFLGSTTILNLKRLLSIAGLTYVQPSGYSDLEMAITVCGKTCCDLGVTSAGCPSNCPPSSHAGLIIGLAAGVGGVLLLAAIATAAYMYVKKCRATRSPPMAKSPDAPSTAASATSTSSTAVEP